MATNNAQSIVNGIISGVDTDITVKVAVNSIDPVDVGNATSAWQAMVSIWEKTNLEDILPQGAGVPVDLTPQDGAVYWQELLAGYTYWRKENGAWVNKFTLSFNVTVEDGILSGLRTFINGDIVTVEKGTWSISNVRYFKNTQTQFTVPAADLNFLRYDLIYADTNNDILYLQGVASASPAFPAVPANCIAVDYVVVPSSSNGANPYLLSGGTNSAAVIIDVTSDANGEYDASGDNIPLWPKFNFFDKTTGDTLTASYNSITKMIQFLPPSTAFIGNFS